MEFHIVKGLGVHLVVDAHVVSSFGLPLRYSGIVLNGDPGP